jgi:hypothetical protein
VRHLLNEEVAVEPAAAIEDRDWRWFVGLDTEATRIGNALWAGESVQPEVQGRVLALFRLRFADASRVDKRAAGHPVYLILAMTPDRMVRLKPQNLIVGLPLAAGARAA